MVRSPAGWVNSYWHNHTQIYQCKFKQSQKAAFIKTAAHFAQKLKTTKLPQAYSDALLSVFSNEVNFYVDDATRSALGRSMVGLIFFRGRASNEHLERLRRFQKRLRELGKEVPVFKLTSEQPTFKPGIRVPVYTSQHPLQMWRLNGTVHLLAP
eukprot:1601240-Prymnesium_polylepis.1